MTRIFIDTEFTCFQEDGAMELISIGLVAQHDSREFYGERNDFHQADCSEFTRNFVLPHLGRLPKNVYSRDGLKDALLAWLQQFEYEGAVVAYDFMGDWSLFWELLDRRIPEWISAENVQGNIDKLEVERFFADTDLPRHHALTDARANQFAFRAGKPKLHLDSVMFPLSSDGV